MDRDERSVKLPEWPPDLWQASALFMEYSGTFPGRFREARYRGPCVDQGSPTARVAGGIPDRCATEGPRRAGNKIATPAKEMESGMSSDQHANPVATPWICANCSADFAWTPVTFVGLPFCCSGCAASGPCMCSYEDVPERSPAAFGAAGALPEAGPHPPVPMTEEVRVRLVREVEALSAAVAGGDAGRHWSPLVAVHELGEGLSEQVKRLLVAEDLLARARVPQHDGHAVVGSRIKVYDGGDRIPAYQIVLPWDADPGSRRIAPDSPMGRALLGARAGDTVEVRMSGARRTLLVVEVRDHGDAIQEQATSRQPEISRREAPVVSTAPSRG